MSRHKTKTKSQYEYICKVADIALKMLQNYNTLEMSVPNQNYI